MKLFVDANVFIAVTNKEYPLFPDAARILSLYDKKGVQLYTSPLCLAITFYFAGKKFGAAKAKEKIALIANHAHLTEHHVKDVTAVAQNKEILDFEDGLEYYSALRSKCDCIITYDVDDFWFSEIPVMTPSDFIVQMMKQK
jgi:predicted nucleic acid-binding protein